MSISSPYTFPEHKHRCALWTAARAVSRNFCDTQSLKNMVEELKFEEAVDKLKKESFEKDFYKICNTVLSYFLKHERPEKSKGGDKSQGQFINPTFGRAAKFVSIYLKTYYILDTRTDEGLRDIIYPPIDRILLHGIAKNEELLKSFESDQELLDKLKELKKINWTQLTQEKYESLKKDIESFKLEFNWTLEKYWQPTEKE